MTPLAIVGSSPALLAMVPEEHRGTVASFGEGAARVSGGDGGLFRPAHADAANSTVPGTAVPLRGEWSPRRAADIQSPAGLIAGVDYAVEATEDGYLAHWPCEHEIPVRSYDAPPGSEPDLAWAVETPSPAASPSGRQGAVPRETARATAPSP